VGGKDDDTLTIEVRRPGWRFGTIGGLILGVFWCTGWYEFVGRTVMLIMCTVFGLLVLDRVFTRWRLRVGPALVSATRGSLFGSEGWSCRRNEFQVGEIETDVDDEGTPVMDARFIRLQLLDQDVRFMEGHRDEELETVRSKILLWVDANPARRG
jgi:hypothetical protein